MGIKSSTAAKTSSTAAKTSSTAAKTSSIAAKTSSTASGKQNPSKAAALVVKKTLSSLIADTLSGLTPVSLRSDFSFKVGNDIMCKKSDSKRAQRVCPVRLEGASRGGRAPKGSKYVVFDNASRSSDNNQKCDSYITGNHKCAPMSSMLTDSVKTSWSNGKSGLMAAINFDRAQNWNGNKHGGHPIENTCGCNSYVEFSADEVIYAKKLVIGISGDPICFSCSNSHGSMGGRYANNLLQSCARFLNMVVYSRTAETEEWELMNAAPIFFDGGSKIGQCSASGLSTLFLEDGSQKYVLRLPQIKVRQMRVFFLCVLHTRTLLEYKAHSTTLVMSTLRVEKRVNPYLLVETRLSWICNIERSPYNF